jgi:hypothetical protein
MVSMMLNDILKTKNQEHGGPTNYVHERNLILFKLQGLAIENNTTKNKD